MSTEPGHVLELISGLDVGGAEAALLRVATGLRDRGWAIEVTSLTGLGPTGDALKQAGIPVECLGMTRGRPSARALGRLVQRLAERPPDILQSWLYHADLLGTIAVGCVPGPLLAWNVRASNMDFSAYRPMSRWTLGACIALSARPEVVIANSHAGVAHHAALGYRPRRWFVIPNGFDGDVFHPDPEARRVLRREAGLGPDDLVIALVARFDPMKDHESFIRAAGLFAREHPDARFLLAGEGVAPSNAVLAGWIREEGLGERVRLLGRRGDIPAIWAAADVATLTSVSEGFPNALGEAMACGVPCVATDVGDVAELLGNTGIVVPPGRPEALADGWRRMGSRGRTEMEALGLKARQRVLSEYGPEACLDQYEAVYHELLGAH